MTRKDYQLIARAIKYVREHYAQPASDREAIIATLDVLSDRLADELEIDNPKFNPEKFLEATGFYGQEEKKITAF